ncbi:hypothetical protein [Leptospira sarikeiensis]|uniref:Lipoprotein n=1 Tax=Leptospira sarikeiensis TaxID=2484943 RepID=A0A4R9K8P4_9LEPT|nr:hypothetical protein [Leptospira sarikeiensis]TGL62974.1 hypothetical protein EHQ64_07315 [Leptospira sarikeiensis]
MKFRILLGISFLALVHCAYFFPNAGKEGKSPKQLYTECMDTFSDDAKCKEFVLKAIPDADVTLLGATAQISEETSSKLYIRSEMIQKLMSQNKLFVKNLLGEPDEKAIVNSWAPGMEEWVYYRPISKYAEGSRPDKEIRILFSRGAVLKVRHIQPDPIR